MFILKWKVHATKVSSVRDSIDVTLRGALKNSHAGRDADELHLEVRRPCPGAGGRTEAAQKATRAPRELPQFRPRSLPTPPLSPEARYQVQKAREDDESRQGRVGRVDGCDDAERRERKELRKDEDKRRRECRQGRRKDWSADGLQRVHAKGPSPHGRHRESEGCAYIFDFQTM